MWSASGIHIFVAINLQGDIFRTVRHFSKPTLHNVGINCAFSYTIHCRNVCRKFVITVSKDGLYKNRLYSVVEDCHDESFRKSFDISFIDIHSTVSVQRGNGKSINIYYIVIDWHKKEHQYFSVNVLTGGRVNIDRISISDGHRHGRFGHPVIYLLSNNLHNKMNRVFS